MGFNATSKFRMRLLNEDTGRTDPVSVQIGLDGLKLSDANSGRSMRSYKLGDIRWANFPLSDMKASAVRATSRVSESRALTGCRRSR
eukprot:631756-Pelagomonas_calceolata.AAC.1